MTWATHPLFGLLWRARSDCNFEEAGAAWGVRGSNKAGAFGHTISVAVVDLDGRDNVVIANLAHPRYIEYSDLSRLLLTSAGEPPPLVDRRAEAGIRYEESSSDVALADVDNDLDLLVDSGDGVRLAASVPGPDRRVTLRAGGR